MKSVLFFSLAVLSVVIGLFGNGPCGTAMAQELQNISLDDAVRMALERNLGLHISRLGITAAEGDLEAVQGAFDPQASASLFDMKNRSESVTELQGSGIVEDDAVEWNLGMGKLFEPGTRVSLAWDSQRFETNSPFATLDPGYSSTLSLSLAQPLLKGRGREVQTTAVRVAEKSLLSTRLSVEDAATQLAADVKKAYWDLVFAREQMKVLQLSLELARTLHDETKEKIDVGVLAPVEIHLPAAEVARREEQRILGQKVIGDAEDTLKLLLNVPAWEVELIPTEVPEIPAALPELNGVLERALAARKDIRSGEERLQARRIAGVKAKNDLLPDLEISGAVIANGLDDSYGGALDDFDRSGLYSWQVGLSLAIPLGNRSARGAAVRARAEEEQAQASLDLLKQQVTRTVQEAVRNVRLALQGVEAARKTAVASEKGLEAEKAKFEVGLSTTSDVLSRQEDYARALNGEQLARVSLRKALAEVERVQGIGPER